MRSKLLSLGKRIVNTVQYRKYGSRRPSRCDAHMNELPVPCGPWEPWYKDKQTFYSQIFLFGALWWLFSFGMMIYTDSIFLNWGPPDMPGPPSDFVDECEPAD